MPHASRWSLALLVTTAAIGTALPASAHASEVRVAGSVLVVEGGLGEKNGLFATYDAESHEFDVSDLYAPLTAGDGCGPSRTGGGLGCPADGIQSISLIGGDGEDTLGIEDVGNPLPANQDGGDGDDTLTAGRGTNTLHGGPGNDRLRGFYGNDVLDGGEGDDDLAGRMGNDTIDGGPGNDTLLEFFVNQNGVGADTLIGGDGRDTINYGDRADDLSLTLDGQANDGAPGEGDNVDGGPGRDRLVTGTGDDVIGIRDADGDEVQCGANVDKVTVDGLDSVDPDCESVDRPAPTGPAPGGGGGTGGGTGSQPGTTPTTPSGVGPNPKVKVKSVQRGAKGVVRLKARCERACSFTTRGSTVRIGRRTYKLPVATRKIAAGGSKTIKLKLPRKARKAARSALRKGRRVAATLYLTSYYDEGRVVGGPIKRTVKLR
ncbi:MAG TPA: calcium-binding protein [Solirubrobacteraceae bacterium]|jgi:hypothetical protein